MDGVYESEEVDGGVVVEFLRKVPGLIQCLHLGEEKYVGRDFLICYIKGHYLVEGLEVYVDNCGCYFLCVKDRDRYWLSYKSVQNFLYFCVNYKMW